MATPSIKRRFLGAQGHKMEGSSLLSIGFEGCQQFKNRRSQGVTSDER